MSSTKPASPLRELLDYMSTQPKASIDMRAELDAVRRLWTTVRAQSQMQQSLQDVPETTGPLNAASLVSRSMDLMREVSPGYLQHFLSYADDLSWMERISAAAAPAPTGAQQQPATIGKRPGKPRARKSKS